MLSRLRTFSRHGASPWWAYAVLLLMPGGFVVMPVLWLARRRAARRLAG